MLRTFLLFWAAFTLLPVSLQADDAASTLDNYLQDLDTYSAAFEQQLFNEHDELIEKSVGVFYLRRPGMFHWAYVDPYSQMLISDSRSLWIYEEDLQQVIIQDIGESLGKSPAAILGGNVSIKEHYLVIDMGMSEGHHWLEMTPRDINSQYNSIRLGFLGEQLSQMLLFDNLGQKNMIGFLDIKLNKTLNLELFTFTPPADTDIIDNRQ